MSVSERIILLKKIKYSEADLILQGLSSTRGKISLIAKGALKSKKRFAGGILDPTHVIMAQYKDPKSMNSHSTNSLMVLEEASLLHGFENLRKQYDYINEALNVVEIVGKISHEEDPHSEPLFDLTGHALYGLNQGVSLSHFRVHFFLRLMLQQGILDRATWMEPYLKTPMANTNNLVSLLIQQDQLDWISANKSLLLQP